MSLTNRLTAPVIGLVAAGLAAACCADGAPARATETAHRVGAPPQIFVVARNGGARRLTGASRRNYFPAWSPDTLPIATFHSSSPSRTFIELLDGGAEVTRRLWAGWRVSSAASWSPDGDLLAFVATRPSGNEELVTVSVENGTRRVLAENATGRPAWSPDGRTIYYQHQKRSSLIGPDSIWSVPSRGGKPRELVAHADGFGGVSRDGRWLVFARYGEVGIARTDGSGERRLLTGIYSPTIGWVPQSPNIYVHGGGGHSQGYLRTVSRTGTVRRPGVRFPSPQMTWSPDRTRIAWVTHLPSRHEADVRSSRPNGTGRRLLARFVSNESYPEIATLAWSPDSQRLILDVAEHSGD